MADYHLEYNDAKGHFEIKLFNQYMLGGMIKARIGKHDALPKKVKQFEGIDDLGIHTGYRILYESDANEKRRFTGIVRMYSDFIVFEIVNHYKIKGKNKKSIFEHPYIAFPNFEGDVWADDCAMLSYKRQVPFNYPLMWQGRVIQPLRDGKHSPLLVTNSRLETVILSPFNHLLNGTVSINSFPPEIKCGLPRAVKMIEKDTEYQTVLVLGRGVNRTLARWGDILRVRHQTSAIPKDADVLLTHLSYWTNAGASYWYHTHRKTSYEATLKALRAHHDQIGIAFGSYQLDSWWYQKEGDHYTAGIVDWAPKESTLSKNFNAMLPFFQKYKRLKLFDEARISHVQSILKKPLGCHFKQLANDSVYVKACPDDFTLDAFAIPKTREASKKLFLEIFAHPKWHLSFVIHDWLQYMNDHHRTFRDLTISEGYFSGLDEACCTIESSDNATGHLTLQLCMTQPHMTLNSVAMQSVTTIRSTSDSASFFIEGTNRWWWHLYASPFIHALGKYPFYDNRLSGSSHTHPFSSYAKFEFIWLGLSCGPIGLGDKIGSENIELIRRVALNDGEIVKPDVPCQPLDKCFLYNPRLLQNDRGVAVYSYSELPYSCGHPAAPAKDLSDLEKNGYPIYYLLLFNVHPFGRKVTLEVAVNEMMTAASTTATVATEASTTEASTTEASTTEASTTEASTTTETMTYYVYDYFKRSGYLTDAEISMTYTMARRKFFYQIIAPVVADAAVIGDVSMHVAGSRQLISEVIINESRVIFKCFRAKHPGASHIVVYLRECPREVTLNGMRMAFEWQDGLLRLVIHAVFDSAEIMILR